MMKLVKAKEPFRFFARLGLTAATGIKAKDARELLEALRAASDSMVYAHTHRFLREHQALVPEPANDFSVWAKGALQDEVLAEKLEAVDTVAYASIKELKEALVQVLERHTAKHPSGRSAPEGEEFHFMRSIRFSVPTSHEASDLAGFRDALARVGPSTVYLHVFEAKIRPPFGVNDFSVWLENELGEKALAKKVSHLDPYGRTLDEVKGQILEALDERIKELSRAAA